jgi:hypothetical protein
VIHLYILILEHFDGDFIRSQINDSTKPDLFNDDLIGRISSKFYGLIRSELDAIPVSLLFHMLSHHLLMISSEDDLFSYISSRVGSDPEYLALLQFVRFECLSAEFAAYFLSALPDSIDHRRLWEPISQRLIPPFCLLGVELPLNDAGSLNGIISYLTRKDSGNVRDKGIVTIRQSRFVMAIGKNCRISSNSLLRGVATQRTGQVSGFAGISANCASGRLMTQSQVTLCNRG